MRLDFGVGKGYCGETIGAASSVVERVPDKNEVEGSIPSPPTVIIKIQIYAEIYQQNF